MCRNVYWHCIFCAKVLYQSTIPHLCHDAKASGFECHPHKQEPWAIPSYSLCFGCKRTRMPRRQCRGFSRPPLISELGGNELGGVSDTSKCEDSECALEVELELESFIWEWIPTPTAASFATTSTTQLKSETVSDSDRGGSSWYNEFSDCDSDEQRESDVHVPDSLDLSVDQSFQPLQVALDEDSQGNEDSSVLSARYIHFYPVKNNRSSIPIPVHRGRDMAQQSSSQAGRLRSNIPVASGRIPITSSRRRQNSVALATTITTSSTEGEGILDVPDKVQDLELFDRITF